KKAGEACSPAFRSYLQLEERYSPRVELRGITHVGESEAAHVPPCDSLHRLRAHVFQLVDKPFRLMIITFIELRSRKKVCQGGVGLVVEKIFGDELLLELLETNGVEHALLQIENRCSHQFERCIWCNRR